MEKEIIKRWEDGKENLRKWFKSTPQKQYPSYKSIVKALIMHCLNYNIERRYDLISKSFEISDHGDYQGTQIFLLHRVTCQPCIEDYIVFDNEYGSCSGCDMLQYIQCVGNYEGEPPTDEQVDLYMTLCLHMVQRMKYLKDLYKDEQDDI